MDEGEPKHSDNKTVLIVVIIVSVLVLTALALGGWYLFLKKSSERGVCTSNSKCQSGLICANKICSSGKLNSSCDTKDQCKTGYCVNNKCTDGEKNSACSVKTDCKTGYCVSGQCTEGKINDACSTYNDCESGLLCLKNKCTQKPDFSKYFEKIVISKIKPGMGPGPGNPETETTEFAAGTDAIEVNLVGVKPATAGQFYFELINSTTGETALSTQTRQGPTSINGHDIGIGTDLTGTAPGSYDFNLYFNNELLYTTSVLVK